MGRGSCLKEKEAIGMSRHKAGQIENNTMYQFLPPTFRGPEHYIQCLPSTSSPHPSSSHPSHLSASRWRDRTIPVHHKHHATRVSPYNKCFKFFRNHQHLQTSLIQRFGSSVQVDAGEQEIRWIYAFPACDE